MMHHTHHFVRSALKQLSSSNGLTRSDFVMTRFLCPTAAFRDRKCWHFYKVVATTRLAVSSCFLPAGAWLITSTLPSSLHMLAPSMHSSGYHRHSSCVLHVFRLVPWSLALTATSTTTRSSMPPSASTRTLAACSSQPTAMLSHT